MSSAAIEPSGIEEAVLSTLRECSLGGSDREVSLSDPLGELGLGLDSLALLEFVTALEKKFRIQFPDDIWTDRGDLTLGHFVQLIAESAPPVDAREPEEEWQPGSPLQKVVRAIGKRGLLRGIAWSAGKLAELTYRRVSQVEKHYILAFDLRNAEIPAYRAAIDVELRIAGAGDEEALSKIKVRKPKIMDSRLYATRLASGFTCLVAWHDGKIVGVDWISEKGNHDERTGLRFSMREGSCYGLDLYEAKGFTRKGVGLALLSYSLVVSRERGYARQITWVDATNARMLGVAMQVFRFEKIGEIRTRRIFGRPFSTWSAEAQHGRRKIDL
jgi:acyl carrier protein